MTYKCGQCIDGISNSQYTTTDDGEIEYQDCPICKGTGRVKDRRQSQRRQGAGRRAIDKAEALLARLDKTPLEEAMALLERSGRLLHSASINAHQKLRKRCANCASEIDAFREKINER